MDVTAVFDGNIGPATKAMQDLARQAKAMKGQVQDDLTFTPRMNDAQMRKALGQMRGGGGGGAFQAANAGAQIQDIAVQLQGGQQLTTVMSQQLPQLLSGFGALAGTVGTIVAVGGALYGVVKASNEAFDALITGARESRAGLDVLLSTGGVTDLTKALQELSSVSTGLSSGKKKIGGLADLATDFFTLPKGIARGRASSDDKQVALRNEQLATADAQLALQKRLVELSDEELKIQKLKANGQTELAAELETELRLKQKLAQLDQLPLGSATKDKLKENAKAAVEADRAAAKEAARAKKEAEALKEKESLMQSIRAQQKALREEDNASLTGQARLDALRQQQKDRQNDAALNGLSLSESGIAGMRNSGNLKGADASLRALREYLSVQREIAALEKQMAADAARTAKQDTTKQQAADKRGLLTTQRALAQTQEILAAAADKAQQKKAMASDAAITHARAHGHERKAERLETAAGIQSKAADLMAVGVPAAEAQKMAQQQQRDEDKLAGKKGSIRGGVSSTEWGLGSASFSSLDAMAAKKGKSLASEFSFPALDEMKRRQTRGAGGIQPQPQQQKDAGADAVTVLNQLLEVQRAIEAKLTFAN